MVQRAETSSAEMTRRFMPRPRRRPSWTKALAFVLALMAVARGSSSSDDADSLGLVMPRYNVSTSIPTVNIVGGSSVQDTGAYRWIVSLQEKDGMEYAHACAGIVIHKKWVLTSAHCIENYDIKRVILGTTIITMAEGRVKRKVKDAIVHPEFSEDPVINDIALIKLDKKVPRKIKPVKLYTIDSREDLDEDGEMATIAGWGATFEGGWSKDVLRTAQVPLVSYESCTAKGSISAKRITEDMLCAGYEEGGVDTCSGDSGGPLFVQNKKAQDVVIGVTSWGEGCARAGKYGVYTRVSSYIDWIEENANIEF